MKRYLVPNLALLIGLIPAFAEPNPESLLPGGAEVWELVWNEEFDGEGEQFDENWESQNGPSGHILSSRWRENVEISNGSLKLLNRKENRGGQEWTSGNIWTKERFLYGYFECRYRYAAATGTNNSFWLMTKGPSPKEGKRFEIDINEGHFPNEVNTNIHNWSDITEIDGKKVHPSASRSFPFGMTPEITIQLEIPVTAKKVRFSSGHHRHFHIGEFQILSVSNTGYPELLSPAKDQPGLVNHARDPATEVSVSGAFKPGQARTEHLTDGDPTSTWISQKEGLKWIEFSFAEEKTIGCIQFLNGWKNKEGWSHLISDYKIEYHNGAEWIEMAAFDVLNGDFNFAKDFHTYGLEWTKDEIVFYLDGKELRRESNEFCYSPSPVWLSLAIIEWAGAVTDAIDGTQMEVDYVRIYKPAH